MIFIQANVDLQLQNLSTKYCDHKTKGEAGRSAFWIWLDKLHNAIRYVNTKEAKKIGTSLYRFHMKYWGDIFFETVQNRKNGRFSGYDILITELRIDTANFHKWLQHESLTDLSAASPKKPKTFRKISKSIGMGYLKVRTKSGQWMIADADGKPVSGDLFKDVSYMRKSKKGDPMTIVNKNGWAYFYLPEREAAQRLVSIGKAYKDVIGESVHRQSHGTSNISEATINGRTYMCEKMMGKWKCIDGMYYDYVFSEYGKGDCYDVRMYMDTTVPKDEPGTICLFMREDNGRYFYCEIVKAPWKGPKETEFSILPLSKVPKEIRADFRTLPPPPESVLKTPAWRRKKRRSLVL